MTDRRIVHMGLGNFHRAHQCWWTWVVAHPDDREQWTVTAFTGRRPDAAAVLNAQGCRYTLVKRDSEEDRFEIVTALREAFDGADQATFDARVADPATGVVTMTVTEAGYHLEAAPPARLLSGLRARFRAGGAPIAVVPCDNLSTNGVRIADLLLTLAADEPDLRAWLSTEVSFVNTSVDRITPRPTADDLAKVERLTGFADRAPVITEPFHDWVLSGDFPGSRPHWERADAQFVDDIEPWEHRKLWLLNGAHSLMAYVGLLRGCQTLADANADDTITAATEAWWAEVATLLDPDEVADYVPRLRARFANTAIGYPLTQITENGPEKMRVRVAEPAVALRAAGRSADAAALAIAAYLNYVEASPDTAGAVSRLSDALADDKTFVDTITDFRTQIGRTR
jgi:fructuronate reductase